jgi:hypothetical protein
LRIQLVPHDDRDERLIDALLARTPDERLASLEEQLEFLAARGTVEPRDRRSPRRRGRFRSPMHAGREQRRET